MKFISQFVPSRPRSKPILKNQLNAITIMPLAICYEILCVYERPIYIAHNYCLLCCIVALKNTVPLIGHDFLCTSSSVIVSSKHRTRFRRPTDKCRITASFAFLFFIFIFVFHLYIILLLFISWSKFAGNIFSQNNNTMVYYYYYTCPNSLL